MNENTISVANETSVITSTQSSYSNDIIDLTEMNDSDECEVTSSCSVIVSNNLINPPHPENGSNKVSNPSADDSISILYENIQPPPEVEVVNEVFISSSGENELVNNFSNSIPPVIMGSGSYVPIPELHQIPNLIPQISRNASESSIFSAIRSYPIRTPYHSTLSSCKYTPVTNRLPPNVSVIASHPVALQRLALPTNDVPLNLKTLSNNPPGHSSDLEKSNTEEKVPKIQCGICLDGPDEIGTSGRNFTSTNCGHVFCNECIKTALRTSSKCPKCRKRLTAKQIHPLYL